MAQFGQDLLQAELDAVRSSQLAHQLGNMSASINGILARLDVPSLILLVVTIVVFLIPILIIFPPIPVERSDALRQTHTKVGLPPHQSNLKDQQAPIHGTKVGKSPKVKSLYIYPVKSCRGIEVQRSKIVPTGLEYDRLFVLAQLKPPSSGKEAELDKHGRPVWDFLTLRQLPLMANVKVDLWLPDSKKTSRQLGKVDEAFIVIRFPWTDRGVGGMMQRVVAKMSRGLKGVPEKEFMLPVAFPPEEEIKARGYTYAGVKVWRDIVPALNFEKEMPPELKEYLGVKHRLSIFRVDPSSPVKIFRNAPTKEELGYQPIIGFQDAYPLHIMSLSSMQALATKVVKDETMQQLDTRRFRANIIMSGVDAWEEDDWKRIRMENASTKEACNFNLACRTVRCKLPNVDPDTGIRHKAEPDRALRKYRDVDEGAPKSGCFGMQMVPEFHGATTPDDHYSYIEVGMDIDVLLRGQSKYIKLLS